MRFKRSSNFRFEFVNWHKTSLHRFVSFHSEINVIDFVDFFFHWKLSRLKQIRVHFNRFWICMQLCDLWWWTVKPWGLCKLQHLIEDMKHTNIKTNRKKNDSHVRLIKWRALIKMAISIDPIRVILTEQPRKKLAAHVLQLL